MRITAIIVTYNRPDALRVILNSIQNQFLIPEEVIIDDDGSGPETKAVVDEFKKKLNTNLKHVWQEDKGFRAASIRNKAIRESSGDCLLFSDGDLVFHPKFFFDFSKKMKPGVALVGSRVFLTEKATVKILEKGKKQKTTPLLSNTIEQNPLNSLRIPALGKWVSKSRFSKNMRGGLLCAWKNDIVKINGWNEDFKGWGLEDTELVARLFYSGVEVKKLKLAGITYHLWHPILSREEISDNQQILDLCLKNQLTICGNGLIKKETF